MNDVKPITTNHHQYLVALTFDKEEKDHRVIVEIEKTDTDELMMIIHGKNYYFSLKQFMQLVNEIS